MPLRIQILHFGIDFDEKTEVVEQARDARELRAAGKERAHQGIALLYSTNACGISAVCPQVHGILTSM